MHKSSHHYNLGLFLKTRGRFRDGVIANQTAATLVDRAPESYEWNLGHLRDRRGRRIERLSPCHGIIRSVLYQDLGIDYGDVILFDGAPITYHTYGEKKIPVFPHLATLLRNHCRVFDFACTQEAAGQIADASNGREIRTGLAKFLFARESVFQRVSDLSGGERLRAALARGFLVTQKPELLLLDEPTNNLDLANVDFLAGIVSGFRGALIVVSHDERFLENRGILQELVVRRSRG